MYSFLSSQFGRGLHKKASDSLRIHRGKPAQQVSDGATTSFTPDFAVAKRICEQNQGKLDELNGRIESHEGKRIEKNLRKVDRIERHISNLKQTLEKGGRHLVPIGSYANGLFSASSDIDLVLMPYNNDNDCMEFAKKFHNSESFRKAYMLAVKSSARRRSHIASFNTIYSAKVPILKLKLADGTEIDIQFNNPSTIGSSLYTKACIDADPRVAALIGWLKESLTRAGLKGNQSAFSMYHCVFLVLHFLHNKHLGFEVLPPSELFDLESAVNWRKAAKLITSNESLVVADFHSNCRLTPAELAIYMCDYYAQIKLSQTSLNINGDIFPRAAGEPLMFMSPFFNGPETECKVQSAPYILTNHFESVLKLAQEGMFVSL